LVLLQHQTTTSNSETIGFPIVDPSHSANVAHCAGPAKIGRFRGLNDRFGAR
jgi:hypothetical protein